MGRQIQKTWRALQYMQLNWSQSMFIGVAAAAVQYTTSIPVTFANGQFDGIKCNWWRPVPRVIDTKHGCSFLSIEILCYLVLFARINFEKNIYAHTLHSHSQFDFVRWYCRQGVETDCDNMLLILWWLPSFFLHRDKFELQLPDWKSVGEWSEIEWNVKLTHGQKKNI